jgi:uncharacterized protein (DUF362 family)
MPEELISLVGYENIESVKLAIEKCRGFDNLQISDKILIKPNLVAWDNLGPYPPWGVLTTSVVVEGICLALKDFGVSDITIGEGSIHCKEIGSSTTNIFKKLGYDKLSKKDGAKIFDFNEGNHNEVSISDNHKLSITDHLDNCDFFINVPVLKTHVETVVSLGMKNLKGLLSGNSKKFCHHNDNLLDHFIFKLAENFPPTLTIIDGIYTNERGPLHFGRARRRDLLIASTDAYAADLVGSYILGYGTDEVKHLNMWADKFARTKDVSEMNIVTANEYRDFKYRGDDNLEENCVQLEKAKRIIPYDWEWTPDNTCPDIYEKIGIKGIILPKYDYTLCTGCSFMYIPLMVGLMSIKQKEFEDFEFLTGKTMKPTGRAKKTFLLGKCQIALNKNNSKCGEIIEMKGCPPSIKDLFKTFEKHGISISESIHDQYRTDTMKRYLDKPKLFPLKHFYMKDVTPAELLK